MEVFGRALHTCVAGIDRGPSFLKHKYHRHLNHEGPEGGFGGSRQLSLFWGGEVLATWLYRPPPPPSKCKPARLPQWHLKMGQQGPLGVKKKLYSKSDCGPCGMPKRVFLARFEPVVARFGPPNIPKSLQTGLFYDQKRVKNGSKTCLSKTDPGLVGVHKQMK